MLLVSRGLKSQIYAHVSQLYKQFTKEVVESNKLAWAFPPRQLTDSAEANADAIVPFCVPPQPMPITVSDDPCRPIFTAQTKHIIFNQLEQDNAERFDGRFARCI